MNTPIYNSNKTLTQNVVDLFKFVSWTYREILQGRVPMNKAELQDNINKVDQTQSIAFVTLAEAGQIDDVTASEHTDLFIPWAENTPYKAWQLRKYAVIDEKGMAAETKLYRCLQDHTSQADWTPDITPSLWKVTSDPAEEYPAWSQPVGAADAYNMGDKVSHNDKKWTSDVDGNVWEPGVYGWTEVQA